MKTAKLIIGIASIVLSIFVLFQSCAAGAVNALSSNGEVGGSAGFILAIFMLIAGIVGIATRHSLGRGGAITCGCLYILGAVVGALMAGGYSDLYIWSVLSFIFGGVYLIGVIFNKG